MHPRLSTIVQIVAILLLALATENAHAADTARSLAGRWRFQLDPADTGIGAQWFDGSLPDSIKLPGSLCAQGYGDEVGTNTTWTGEIVDRSWFTTLEYEQYRQAGNVKVPFWLQPEKYYSGAAWYQRDIEIPPKWQDKRVVLFLERPHWETRVWVDGRGCGTNTSLFTPHEYDLGTLAPGKHTLSIRVDNRRIVDIGENSHGISDHTQGNWNGIAGRIELRATPLTWIEDVQVYPDFSRQKARVVVTIGNQSGRAGVGNLFVSTGRPESGGIDAPMPVYVTWNTNGGNVGFDVPVQDGRAWDEFSPHLQNLKISLADFADLNHPMDTRECVFGMRDLSTDGTRITLNRRVLFLRGTLECCIFPKTGHPPTGIAEWKRIIGIAQAHGLNLLRFHSYCPPDAAFQAADELGMYLQVETCWPNQSTSLGDGKPVDTWVRDETDRILKWYGNHPSFVLMLHGNEPGGKKAGEYLARYVEHYKARDPRRLWSSGAGWPQLPANSFHITPDPRIQGWGDGLKSRINAKPPETVTDYRDYIRQRNVPVISHEIGQWCAYPDFTEMKQYTGPLKPRNFEIFRDRLARNGMSGLARRFLLASGKLQTLCYKEDIESALRTPGMGGFELLNLHDFPGQGSALVGVLNPFWEEKGYVTAREYSRFCGSIVPLARMSKRVFVTHETLAAGLEVANFGNSPLTNIIPRVRIVAENGRTQTETFLAVQDVPVGNGIPLSPVNLDLSRLSAPARYKLVVSLLHDRNSASQPVCENDWDFWVYPVAAPDKENPAVRVTSRFDDAARACLDSGGRVLLTIPGTEVRNFDTAPVEPGFSSIFWNTAWTKRQAPTTLGILCDPEHPALARFPTDFHSNWQWWYLIHRAGALRLDLLPREVDPVVRIIDDWFTARPLGLIVEGRVGAGKMIICGFDLTRDANDPVSRQMRTSLMDYMASRKFAPKVELTAAQVASLIREAR
jgi:hypothetical protein